MALKSTRKILSIILAVFIAISSVSFCASIVLGESFATKKFVVKHIVTNELVADCEKQLDIKYEALEQKCGIPARVFETIKTSFSTRDSLKQAAEYLFDENDPTLYNDNRIDYFYEMCVEYLEGNEFDYDKDNVRNVAIEATQIYSDSVGIHNASEIKHYVEDTRIACQRIQSVSVLVLAISCLMILIMYKKKQEGALYVGAGIMGGGIATILGSLLSIITKLGSSIDISPVVYKNTFSHMTNSYFGIVILAGLVILLAGAGVFAAGAYKINLEQNRKSARFTKIVAKL